MTLEQAGKTVDKSAFSCKCPEASQCPRLERDRTVLGRAPPAPVTQGSGREPAKWIHGGSLGPGFAQAPGPGCLEEEAQVPWGAGLPRA